MQLVGAKIVIKVLEELGIKTVFGYTGNYAMPLFEALEATDIDLKVPTSEVAGAHAADGYYRASGKLAAVITTSGPGATNLVTGIATAYMDSVPFLAITANVPTFKLGKDSFQEVDITGIVTPVTKYAHIVKDVNDLEKEIKKAYALAIGGRTAPVLIDIPYDVLTATAEYKNLPLPTVTEPVWKAEDIARAAALLNGAERPAILVGGGANKAGKLIAELAGKLQAPVFTTMRGIGIADTPFSVGCVGSAAPAANNRLYAKSDVILALGTRFSDRMHSKHQNRKFIHVDIDNAELDKIVPAEVAICAPLEKVLGSLTELIKSREARAFAPPAPVKKKSGVMRLAEKVAESDLTNVIIATDVGNHQIALLNSLPFKPHREIVSSLGLGTMGFGLPALIGACVATGKRGILFTGDGSFNMNINELATAVKLGLDITVIIANNRELGMIKNLEKKKAEGLPTEAIDTPLVNYALAARSFGARGKKATTKNIASLLANPESGVAVYDVKVRA